MNSVDWGDFSERVLATLLYHYYVASPIPGPLKFYNVVNADRDVVLDGSGVEELVRKYFPKEIGNGKA